MMKTTFESSGEAMIMAGEGQMQIARAFSRLIRKAAEGFRSWLADMPTTMPPTQSHGPR